MTLEYLYNILNKTSLPVAYHHFEEDTKPPYIVYLVDNNDNFMADNKVYKKIININIELYTNKKDIELENKLEDILDENNICYTSNETYIDSEKMYQKIYMIGEI